MRRPLVRATLPLAALAAAAVWWALPRSRPRPANVLIVTLDTTRADRLSPYGYMDASMPAFERLAREGVVFDQATSVAPLTLPAHATLFTGLLPPRHGVRDNAAPPLEGRFTTLAEILQARGMRTGAFVGSMVVGPERGLAQGFDRYGSSAPQRERRADAVVADGIGWLDGIGGAPFLLWAHFYDPHRPYDPPGTFGSRHFNPYIGELAFVDEQLGALLAALDARKLTDRTLVVVAADHGESLGDHGERDHGIFVYESVLRVPLIVRAPGVRAARVPGVVRLTDVMPTVLDLLDVPAPPMDGVSLVDLLDGRRRDLGLEAYAESDYPRRLGWSALRSLREGRFKLIDAPRPELYDLERDPFEERNVHDERPQTSAAMAKRLRTLAGSPPDVPPAPAPRELAEQLAALGYVTPGPRSDPASGRRPDPKDCIGLIAATPEQREALQRTMHAACR